MRPSRSLFILVETVALLCGFLFRPPSPTSMTPFSLSQSSPHQPVFLLHLYPLIPLHTPTMSKTTLLPDQVFICPRSRCCTFSTTTSDAILHLRDSHSHLLDTPHGIELEKYVTPTELIPATEAIKYSPSDSPIHLCTPCLQLLPSIAAAKDHLHKTPLHARDVAKQVRLNGANSVHRLLRTVKFKLEEPKLSVPAIAPERIVYRQNNYISGRNKEIVSSPSMFCSPRFISLTPPEHPQRTGYAASYRRREIHRSDNRQSSRVRQALWLVLRAAYRSRGYRPSV